MGRVSNRSLWTAKILGKKISDPKAIFSNNIITKTAFEGYILGIDPSLRGTGIAILEFQKNKKPRIHYTSTLIFKNNIPSYQCLGGIAQKIGTIVQQYPIHSVAIEQTVYVQNFKTAHILGATRGAAIAAVAMHGLIVYEYLPLRIKQAVVGSGKASKEQVIKMVQQLTDHSLTLTSDEADAAAIALCHAWTHKNGL